MAGEATDQKNPWLDLVRSAAIILVLLRHGERALNSADGGESERGFVLTFFTNGWVGVDLFFVLSGYLIARHILRARVASEGFRMWRYIAARALRIVPAYYAVLALVALGAFPFFKVAPELLPLRIGYHLVFLQDYLPSNINVVFWSLGVEEKFYLLAPLLIALLLRCQDGRLRAGLLLLLFALPIALRTVAFVPLDETLGYPEFWRSFRSPFHMTLEGLVVGVAIAIAQHDGLIRQSRGFGLGLLAVGSGVFCVWLASHDFMAEIDFGDASTQPAFIAVLAGLITLGAVQLAGTAMPLTPLFRLLSKLSYTLYLIHFPLIPIALALTSGQDAGLFWSCYLTLSLAAAALLHITVERPFLRIKDRLTHSEAGVGLSAVQPSQ